MRNKRINRSKTKKAIFFISMIGILFSGLGILFQTEAIDYERRIKGFDIAGNRSTYTSNRDFIADYTPPTIYFTGDTPTDNTVSSQTHLTGHAEIEELHLQNITRTLDSTDYIFDMTGWFDDFGTGNYSLTDYTDTGLVLAMNFDTSGDVQDYSSYENNGTNSGATWTGNGAYNGAYTFNGINNHIDIGNLGNPTNGSISFWIKQTNINGGVGYIIDGRGIGNFWIITDFVNGSCTDSHGNICFDGLVEVDSDYMNNDQRHSITFTATPSISTAYVDGQLVSTGNGIDLDLSSIKIGTRFTDENFLSGSLDNIRIYNDALTSGQIAQIYNTTITKYNTGGLRDIQTSHTGLSEGIHTYQACATDAADWTSCVDRDYTLDLSAPTIYFTGSTPIDGTITGNTFFLTGEVEALEDHLQKLIRTRDGSSYIFDMTGRWDDFGTGDYSLTDYSDTGLILAMNFDTDGDTNDYSPYGNHGTNVGATWTTDGFFGGAYDFDGDNDEIIVADNSAFSISASNPVMTIETRIYPENGPNNGIGQSIIEKVNTSSKGWNFLFRGDRGNTIIASNRGGHLASEVQSSESSAISLDKWHYVVVVLTYNQNTKIYIDGESDYTVLNNGTPGDITISNDIKIGSGISLDKPFDGIIDNIRIRNKELSSDEITQIYNTTITKYSTGTRGLTTTHTGLEEGTYLYQACAEDIANNTGCTETRSFTVDLTNPYIYFTGSTPASGTISTNTTFTGEIEVLEPYLSGLFRNWDGTEYILHLNDHWNIFNTGVYSWTNYEETGLLLAMNFDNQTGFGETTTIVADLAGGNNTGTITPIGSHRTGDEGVYGGSFFFSGWNVIGVADDISVSSKVVTISTRAKGTGWVLRHGLGHDEIYSMRISTGILVIEYREDAGFRTKTASETFNNSERNYLTITRDNTNIISFYINGKLINSEQGAEARSGGSLVIGGGGNSGQPYNGYIDDLRIYDRVLSDEEIRQLYSTNVTKPADETRSFTVVQEDLTDGTYNYTACAEDQVGLTGCTNEGYRTYNVQTPKTITVKTANQYTTSGDFWLFEQTGATSRRQIFNSSKIINDITPNINYSSSTSTGQISITGQLFPTSGATYLAVYKLTGALAVGYTGVWQDSITGFDFSNANKTNLYPKLPYQNENYLYIGDLDTSSSGAYDLIYGTDLALLNARLSKNTLIPLKPIYDFDYNEVATALEQAMLLYNIDIGGYLQDYLPAGLEITDFKEF